MYITLFRFHLYVRGLRLLKKTAFLRRLKSEFLLKPLNIFALISLLCMESQLNYIKVCVLKTVAVCIPLQCTVKHNLRIDDSV